MTTTETLARIVELFTAAAVKRLDSKGSERDPDDINVDISIQYRVGSEQPVYIEVCENESCLRTILSAETVELALQYSLEAAEAL